MSKEAVGYVHRSRIADEAAKRVFLLLAERTKTTRDPWEGEDELPAIMSLELNDADIPGLAPRAGMNAEEFRRQLRGLKKHVRMDVLEHSADGVWEIVYGPSYDRTAPPRPIVPDTTRGGPHAFWMPGWEKYSTWGYEGPDGDQHLYAQLIANTDGPDAEPRIWITPPRYLVRSVDELAQVVAEAIAPFGPVPPPASLIKAWLTRPPTR